MNDCHTLPGRKTEGREFFLAAFFCLLTVPHGMRGLSSPNVDWTLSPAVETWNLNHWTTKEVPFWCTFYFQLPSAQKNPYVRMVCFGVTYSELLHPFKAVWWGGKPSVPHIKLLCLCHNQVDIFFSTYHWETCNYLVYYKRYFENYSISFFPIYLCTSRPKVSICQGGD